MTVDIGLSDNFDFQLDHRNDAPLLTGRTLFEQRLRIAVTDYFFGYIGDANAPGVEELLKVQARRIADDMDVLDSLVTFTAESSSTLPNALDVRLVYHTGDDFSFTITE